MPDEPQALRRAIEDIFGGKAFLRPLFYQYPGGLRFALSGGGTPLEQFLSALTTCRTICSGIFDTEGSLVACIRVPSEPGRFAHRRVVAELRAAGIRIPAARTLWHGPVDGPDGPPDEGTEHEGWIHLAFQAPLSQLTGLLWCAMAADLGQIRPRPDCCIYLFHLERRVMVWPYDDRGMDVVGPNGGFLAQLYHAHQRHLLDYDRAAMDATFGPPPSPAP